MAAWLFLGCGHTAGGDSRSLQGEGGYGEPLQVGFGQPGVLVRFFWADDCGGEVCWLLCLAAEALAILSHRSL